MKKKNALPIKWMLALVILLTVIALWTDQSSHNRTSSEGANVSSQNFFQFLGSLFGLGNPGHGGPSNANTSSYQGSDFYRQRGGAGNTSGTNAELGTGNLSGTNVGNNAGGIAGTNADQGTGDLSGTNEENNAGNISGNFEATNANQETENITEETNVDQELGNNAETNEETSPENNAETNTEDNQGENAQTSPYNPTNEPGGDSGGNPGITCTAACMPLCQPGCNDGNAWQYHLPTINPIPSDSAASQSVAQQNQQRDLLAALVASQQALAQQVLESAQASKYQTVAAADIKPADATPASQDIVDKIKAAELIQH